MTTTKKPVRKRRPTKAAGARVYVNLSKDVLKAVKQEAVERRIPTSHVLSQQIADRYDPASVDKVDNLVLAELRAVRRELSAVKFHQRASAEVMAVAIKNIVAMLPPPTAEGHKRAASFFNFLASEAEKALAGDRALVDQLAEKILTFSEDAFASVEPAPGSHPADHDALTFEDKDA